MNHRSASLVLLTLLSFVHEGLTQGQAPPTIKPIAPLSGGAPAAPSAPTAPAAPPQSAPIAPPVMPPVAPAPPVAKPVEPTKYVVKAGDNPWKIAKNHGISVEELLKANQIKDSKKLAIGDELLLPVGVESKGAPVATKEVKPASTANAAAPAAGDDWELYTIKSGDNPWNISKRLKVDHRKVMSLNEGLDFTKLKIGQQIKVPKKP